MASDVDRPNAAPVKPIVPPAPPRPSALPEFFRSLATRLDDFITYDNGYRASTYSYSQINPMAGATATRLRDEGLRKGGRVAALWACLIAKNMAPR